MNDYKLEWDSVAQAFVDKLEESDRAAVYYEVDLLSQHLLQGERVKSDPIPTYRIKVVVNKTCWPSNLRVFFRVSHKRTTIYLIDVGDHTTCALHPGQSIYPDER